MFKKFLQVLGLAEGTEKQPEGLLLPLDVYLKCSSRLPLAKENFVQVIDCTFDSLFTPLFKQYD